MSENVTFVDETAKILYEDFDHSEDISKDMFMHYFDACYNALQMVIGIPCNILALLLLLRHRLWHQHEAYVYLATILIINTERLGLYHGNRFIHLISDNFVRPETTGDVACKFLHWIDITINCINWLHVMMLLNVFLRQQLMTSSDRRGCFMNLTDKYCSLLGTKVVIISFFTLCAVGDFWSFSLPTVEHFSDSWYCIVPRIYWTEYDVLWHTFWWLGVNISLLAVIPLLFLVVWKRKRSSEFTFSQMNDASQDGSNDEVDVMTRIVLLCAGVFFFLNAPLFIVYVLHTFSFEFNTDIHKLYNAAYLISLSYSISTPIICFSVKSRFRDDLKSMVERCYYRCRLRTRRPGGCPSAGDDSNYTDVLGLVLIEDDSPDI